MYVGNLIDSSPHDSNHAPSRFGRERVWFFLVSRADILVSGTDGVGGRRLVQCLEGKLALSLQELFGEEEPARLFRKRLRLVGEPVKGLSNRERKRICERK